MSGRAGCLAVVVAFLLATGGTPRAQPRLVRVSLAVSLLPVARELAVAFEHSHPGVRVELNAGGSGVLLQQVRRGAPVDVFISASAAELDTLEQQGRLLPGSRRTVASNRLVILVPPGGAMPQRAGDLSDESYDLIAVGNPSTAPVGRYTRQSLKALGLLDAVRTRLVYAENARQVVEYVARGEVAAGVAYTTDAALGQGRLRRGPELPAETHAPIEYVGAVLRESAVAAAAAEFLESMLSEDAARVLGRHGFLPPP